MLEDWKEQQLAVCAQHGAAPVSVRESDKLGIALDVRTGALPINGLRCLPEHGTCGWYIWAGEAMSQDAAYFKPLHVRHLKEWCEPAIRLLLLPPGWRFLVAGEYVDVWFDPDVDLTPRR